MGLNDYRADFPGMHHGFFAKRSSVPSTLRRRRPSLEERWLAPYCGPYGLIRRADGAEGQVADKEHAFVRGVPSFSMSGGDAKTAMAEP
ncbi:hypothetical protein GCM10010251_80670 [Streptomyces aurantiogriseus]|uniref:Uncharacterized protein n=1 Tax=Streptomyces aurantiogriseus TaxID=66870 RepID=A0A918FLR9_9ACTN|nr:hypothetical protein GCM10010251_80670 [Streptomyces aurantiogriseus]